MAKLQKDIGDLALGMLLLIRHGLFAILFLSDVNHGRRMERATRKGWKMGSLQMTILDKNLNGENDTKI